MILEKNWEKWAAEKIALPVYSNLQELDSPEAFPLYKKMVFIVSIPISAIQEYGHQCMFIKELWHYLEKHYLTIVKKSIILNPIQHNCTKPLYLPILFSIIHFKHMGPAHQRDTLPRLNELTTIFLDRARGR